MIEKDTHGAESFHEQNAPSAALKQQRRSAAALRALEEAAQRRASQATSKVEPEQGGRGGLEPVRYGDWEIKGLASDF